MVRTCDATAKDTALNYIKYDKISDRNWYYLENIETGNCVTFGVHNDETIVSKPCGQVFTRRQGIQFYYENGVYLLPHSTNGECIHLADNNCSEDGRIMGNSCNNVQRGKRFIVVDNCNGSYVIQTFCGKCLHVRDDNKADNAQVVASTCNGTAGQTWRARRIVDFAAFAQNNFRESLIVKGILSHIQSRKIKTKF
jgi:hypothetical protein